MSFTYSAGGAMPTPRLTWDFNGTTTDYVSGVIPISSAGFSYATGKYQQCASFTNTVGSTPTNYIVYDFTAISSAAFTVCCWVNTVASSGGGIAVSIAGGNREGDIRIFLGGTSPGNVLTQYRMLVTPPSTYNYVNAISATNSVVAGVWNHVAVTITESSVNGTVLSCFFNGSLASTYTSAYGAPRNLNGMGVGAFYSLLFNNGFNGLLDDLRIFDRALTSAQVSSIYNQQGVPGRGAFSSSVTGVGTPADFAPSPATIPSATTSTGPFSTEGSLSFTASPGIQVNGAKFPFNWYTGFTVEAWVNYTSFTNALAAGVVPLSMGVIQTAGNIADWAFGPNTTGQLRFYYYFTGQNAQLSSNTMSTGTWTHICAQHDGTSFHMYINGVRCVGPVTITGAVSLSTTHTYFSFGQYLNSSVPNYKIADVRLVRGSNVYPVTGFTPPTDKLGLSPVGTTVFLMQVPLGSSAPVTMTGSPLFSQLSAAAVSSAVGAFSLRAVNGTSARAVAVRRSSDSATQDFYADRLGNLLTAPVTGQSLANWLGGATGYVTTWYDQSGRGNHATQATAANQPVIQRATKGPGYMVNFNGTSQFVTLSANYDFLNGTNITVNAVALRSSTKTSQNWVFGTNTPSVNYQRFQIGFGSDTSMSMNTTSAAPSITIPAYNASNEPVYYMTGGLIPSRVFYQNDVLGGTNINTGLMAVPSGYSYSIGNGVQGGVYYYQGNLFELLIFTSALDQTQVTTLYQNQLSYTGT